MIDYISIIQKFYTPGSDGYNLLVEHSRQVAELASAIASRHPELNIDRDFVYESAMLHDIGIIFCNAPDIGCYGDEDYLLHGILGAEHIRLLGFPDCEIIAGICERHTGSGITAAEIFERKRRRFRRGRI